MLELHETVSSLVWELAIKPWLSARAVSVVNHRVTTQAQRIYSPSASILLFGTPIRSTKAFGDHALLIDSFLHNLPLTDGVLAL